MELSDIIRQTGIRSYRTCTEIHGGKDSQVYKIETDEAAYALRVLPVSQHGQFIREERMIRLAAENGVPVPRVYSITEAGERCAMLMEWSAGHPVLEELNKRPENARNLGMKFGSVQAFINNISLPPSSERTWLTPNEAESHILHGIPADNLQSSLLHLDYHPLNVLTDGETITAVIDWANAAAGDFRFDASRTASLFPLIAYTYFNSNPEVIAEFEQGWRNGYEKIAGPIESLEYYQNFNEWGKIRTKRDLGGRLNGEQFEAIEKWSKTRKERGHLN